VIVAYNAYLKYVQENGEEPPLPGLNYTSLQLFWVSMASQWCSVERLKSMKLNIDLDPHSPERFRVNGPLSNFEGFAKDFNCPPESKMISENKCRVW
jgi:neprilysin